MSVEQFRNHGRIHITIFPKKGDIDFIDDYKKILHDYIKDYCNIPKDYEYTTHISFNKNVFVELLCTHCPLMNTKKCIPLQRDPKGEFRFQIDLQNRIFGYLTGKKFKETQRTVTTMFLGL